MKKESNDDLNKLCVCKNTQEKRPDNSGLDNSPNNSFFCNESVIPRKDKAFKIKCESAIKSTGLSNEQFYIKSEISRQRWYYWSWGIEHFPDHIKIRLCDLFGKPFRDLFLQLKEGVEHE